MTDLEKALAALNKRFDRAQAKQDFGVLLTAGARREARAVAALCDPARDLAATHKLGWYHWLCYLSLPDDGEYRDLAAAHGYFTIVYQSAHGRVLPDGVLPDGVRRALSQEAPSGAAAGTDPIEVIAHGVRLFTAYQKTEHQYLIEQAITLFRVAIAAGPGHPYRAEWLDFLGTALSVLVDRTEDSALLTEAVQVRREAVAVTAVGDPERAGRLASLCHILPSLFKENGETVLLAEAVQAGRDAVAAAAADDPDRADLLNDLGNALSMLFEENGETVLLAEAVQAGRDAVAAAAADDPDRARYQGNLVTALNLEFQRTGEIGVLAGAVQIAREAVAATPAGHRHRAVLVSNLVVALSMLGERTGDDEVLAEAVQIAREAVAATPAGHPDRAARLGNLCGALRTLGECTGKTEVLAEAVQTGRDAVAAAPAGDPDRAVMLSSLAIALHALWDQTRDEGLLAEAVRMGREAVAATPAGHPGRALRFGNLGSALRAMGELTMEDGLLAEAVRLDREAVAAAPAGHPDRAGLLGNLGNALLSLSVRTGETEMLAEAVQAGREAIAATPADHPNRFRRLSALGSSLRVMGERTMAVGLLAEAVEMGREAVLATPARHPSLPEALSSLGDALRALGEATGQTEVLAEAVQAGREAVAATPAGHPDRAGRLSRLGDALRALNRRTGETWLLTEAVRTGQEAVAATPAGDPHRAGWLGNLAVGLFALSMRTRETGQLTEAVQAGREAVAATPVGHPARSRFLSNLAIALVPLSTRTGDTSLLTEAVQAGRDAVAAVPAGHPDRDRLLSNLAAVLLTQPGDAGLLTEAVLVGREAVAAAPAGHPDRARRLRNLGDALRGLSALTGETEPLIEARDCLGEAAENVAAPAITRIGAYRTLASLTTGTGSGQAGLRAAEAAVDLVEMLAPGSLTRPDREYMVSQLAGLAGDVAAAALAAGQPARAVELLEQTRGILVADTLGARGSEQARLRQLAPHLADELSELRMRLDTPDDAVPVPVLDTGQDQDAIWEADRRLAAGRRAAYTAWGQLTDRIRAIPGLEDFLQAPRIGQLAGEAHNGPVVIVTASPARCDALILTGTSAHPVEVVPLTTLTVEGVYQHTISLLAARQAAADPDLSSGARAAAQRQILEVLAWLWDTITGPVLTTLGHATAPAGNADWPRVWWCGGIAAFLPLHAAGHHADHADEDPARRAGARTVLDRVISSYTTTLRGLAYARAHPPGTTTLRTVIVAVPEAPDAQPLPGVTAETTAITALIPTARVLTDPTRAIVLQALPGHQIAHFACHGLADLADPARSRLILPAGSLTVADISALHLTSGLAFLSACDTTVASPRLADESVHITGAFHLAGYPHVIGSLWAVDDRAAAELAADFYSDLTDHGAIPPDIGRSAHALHHATRRLRAQYSNAPSLWAAYTHTGT